MYVHMAVFRKRTEAGRNDRYIFPLLFRLIEKECICEEE